MRIRWKTSLAHLPDDYGGSVLTLDMVQEEHPPPPLKTKNHFSDPLPSPSTKEVLTHPPQFKGVEYTLTEDPIMRH